MNLSLGLSLGSLAVLGGLTPVNLTQRLLARQVAARGGVPSAMVTSPTVTLGSSSPTLTGATIDKSDARIKHLGGDVLDPAGATSPFTSLVQIANKSYVSGNRTGSYAAIEFETSCPKIEARVYSSEPIRVLIDGKESANYLSSPPNDGTPRWLLIDFTPISASMVRRKVRLECRDQGRIGNLTLDTTGQVYAPSDAVGLRACVLQDSFGDGTGADQIWTGLSPKLCESLGFRDIRLSPFGGTGYLVDNVFGSETRPGLPGRIIADGANAHADVYFIPLGINDPTDIAVAPAWWPSGVALNVQAAVDYCIGKIRTANPAALMFFVGPWDINAPSAPNATRVAVDAQISAACAGKGGVYFISALGVAYTKSDATHPDQAGHDTLFAWLDAQVKAIVGAAAPGSFPPVMDVAPVVVGNFIDGENLYAGVGVWQNNPTSYSFQWVRDGSDISGATDFYYAVQPSDLGTAIKVRVTAANADGSVVAESPTVQALYGPNLLPNGTFSDATGWTLQSGWTITGGKLVGSAVGASASASYSLALPAATYRVEWDNMWTSGTGAVLINGTPFPPSLNGSGKKTGQVVRSPAGTVIIIQGNNGSPFTGSLDNLSIRKVL